MAFSELCNNKKIDSTNIFNINDIPQDIKDSSCIIVTGVTGQDGSHMVDYLLKNTEYIIFGGVRRLSVYNHINIKHINSDRFYLINFDLIDTHCVSSVIRELKPLYFINFAAQSYVGCSWDFSYQTFMVNTLSIISILDAIKNYCPKCRLYQAGSSEEFGNIDYSPQDENHLLKPRSPYGASKVSSRQIIKVYRESYDLYAIQCWLFNHEGTRRGEEFVTRKITKKVAHINKAIKNNESFIPLELGNINASRDWSDAEDFMDGIWKMLNQDQYNIHHNTKLNEYVLSSDKTHTIKEFVTLAFKYANIEGFWENETDDVLNDKFYYILNNKKLELVKINKRFYRPAEVDLLLGNSNKARTELKWKPTITFENLVKKMVENDIKLIS
jgi:GDPmannose 4,6-dehydratase